MPRGVRDRYAPLLARFESGCDGCGHELDLPHDPGDLAPEARARLEQFFLGGPPYCDGCCDKAPRCDDCGWHVAPELVAEHHRKAHRE